MAKLKLCQEIFNLIYPIGSVYISTNTTNPSTLFGGSWERVKGKFLLGADDNTYINGATGGEVTHTHTLNNAFAQIRPLAGKITENVIESSNWTTKWISGNIGEESYITTQNAGVPLGGNTDNSCNMPPYLAVYIWKRIN